MARHLVVGNQTISGSMGSLFDPLKKKKKKKKKKSLFPSGRLGGGGGMAGMSM